MRSAAPLLSIPSLRAGNAGGVPGSLRSSYRRIQSTQEEPCHAAAVSLCCAASSGLPPVPAQPAWAVSRAFRGLRFQLISPALPSAVRIASGFFQGGARQSWVRQPRHAHGRSRSSANGVTEVSITTPRCRRQELADSTRLRVSLSWKRCFGRTCLCQRPDEVINSPATERPARIGSGMEDADTDTAIWSQPPGNFTSTPECRQGRPHSKPSAAGTRQSNTARGPCCSPGLDRLHRVQPEDFHIQPSSQIPSLRQTVQTGKRLARTFFTTPSTCLTSHSFSNAHAASFAQTWRFLQEIWHANRGPARACLLVASTDPMPHGSILQHWREFHIQQSSRVLLAIRKQALAVVAISTNA
ncbi:hypothetical protein GQ607_002649 [Colletotrichum asianum]|uniref:Uncharacterized protein n=1 Tax=Colletotrichum asianum TaxID=702518 RepID=A0A8H3WNV5_9PEZI|nr:hypothetical protein GQ607_002649 [Colletotrichum asianum]